MIRTMQSVFVYFCICVIVIIVLLVVYGDIVIFARRVTVVCRVVMNNDINFTIESR